MKKLITHSLIIGGFMLGGMVLVHYVTLWTTPAKIIYKTETITVEATSTTPVMTRIINCESGGKHINPKTGQIQLHVNNDGSVDIGIAQINSTHFATATKLGYDLTKEKDNLAYATWLYQNSGTQPWYSSQACWQK